MIDDSDDFDVCIFNGCDVSHIASLPEGERQAAMDAVKKFDPYASPFDGMSDEEGQALYERMMSRPAVDISRFKRIPETRAPK